MTWLTTKKLRRPNRPAFQQVAPQIDCISPSDLVMKTGLCMLQVWKKARSCGKAAFEAFEFSFFFLPFLPIPFFPPFSTFPKGDRLLAINSNEVTSYDDFLSVIEALPRPIDLTFCREVPSLSPSSSSSSSSSLSSLSFSTRSHIIIY